MEELEEYPDVMKLMAIVEMRGYASAREVFDRNDGAKHVPSDWQEIIMSIREANMNEDKDAGR